MAKTPVTAPIDRESEDDTYPTGDVSKMINAIVWKATTTERDKIPLEMRIGCVCIVASKEKAYKWTGGDWDETYFPGGLIVADTDGAIPTLRHSLIFDDSFAVQAAGDTGAGVLISLSQAIKTAIAAKGTSTAAMTINGKAVKDLTVMPPLQIDESQSQTRLLVEPGSYEPMTAPSFLSKATSIKVISAGVDTTIYPNEPITPYGMYFSPDNQLSGIKIQEDDNRDPNLGGQLTEVMGSASFDELAPSNGTIKMWFMYHQNGAWLPTGYLTGTDGKPIIVEQPFKSGEKLKMVISGAYWAKGQETITMHIEHSFTGEDISLDPDGTLFCANQFENGSGTSLARIEFLRRNGVMIIPSIYKFETHAISMASSMAGINKAETDVKAGAGEEYLSQFGVNNLTGCKASVTNGLLNIKDNGTDILDYYVDYLVDNTRTSMMRGKKFTSTVKMQNDNDSYEFALFSWKGTRNRPAKIYSSRSNGVLNLNAGWTKVKSIFIQENTDNNIKPYTLDVTIPTDAVNLAFAVFPRTAQDPIDTIFEDFTIDPNPEFTGYAEIERYNLNEVHLGVSDKYLELGQNVQGYASLRYTLNYKPINGLPLPMGEIIKGSAPFTLDKTRNAVPGSAARGGEGVRVAQKDGQVSLSFEYLWWNEQKTDSVVDVWVVLYQVGDSDADAIKIDGSQMNFTIPANTTTHGIPKTQPSFIFEIEKGQAFGLRGSANKNDGAYLESTKMTDYMVKPIIDFKELTP